MSPKYLVAAVVLALASASLSAQSVKAGIEAWQRADYAGAVAIWRPLAEKGDADAQFNLGQAYRLGRGVPTNLGAAQTWFERSAKQGHVDAETTLGLLLFQNNEQSDGLKWLKKAADQNEPRAELVYGTALFNGDGVTQDPLLGYAYVSRAAAQGLEPAKQTLAQLDKILPAPDRQKALVLARTSMKATPPSSPTTKAAAKAVKSAAKPTKAEPEGVEVAAAPGVKRTKEAAPHPARASTATGSWRIQLGAFSQRGNAEALYKKVSGNGALSGRQPYYVAAGAVTRLQVGPFESKSAAAAACRALGQACFPVAAK